MTVSISNGTWTNWYQNLSCSAAIVDAFSEQDVLDAVVYAKENGLKVRVAGTGHSNIPLVPNSGIIIVTDRLKGLLSHDTERQTVTFAAGTKIRDMGDVLWALGFSLTNQGDIDTQSIAGAISTGTHGTGLTLQSLSSVVKSFRLIDSEGNIRIVTGRDEHALRAARISIGMLGVITAVELQVSPAYQLHEWIGFLPYDAAAEIEDEMNRKYRHFTYFWGPSERSARWLGFDPGTAAKGADGYACVRIFDPEPIDIRTFEKNTFRRRCDRSYRIFAEDYPPEFDEMEYMVPIEVGRECFEELKSRVRDRFDQTGIPVEVRVTAGDDNYLSQYFGGPRRAISLGGRMHESNNDLFQACDEIFARYDGRTHWAKANLMTRERLERLYPRYGDFIALRRSMDPRGMFLNDYLAPLFE